MITSKYNWKNIEKEPDDGFFEVTKKENITALASKILYSRGIDNGEKLAQFLSNDLSQLHDPYLLHDMDKAVARIRQAIENYEQILVYGDYDADGMTSASIMKEALECLGLRFKSIFLTDLLMVMDQMNLFISISSSNNRFL